MKTKDEIRIEKNKILTEFLNKTGKIDRPPCHKCQHKVPAMTIDVDLKADQIRIILMCHGEKEIVTVPISRIDKISHLEMAWAFFDSTQINGEKMRPLFIH